ncbi:AMP deaminase 2 [Echinococcus granulosus]|nr:AMP deaminase 2 [Echinococcus granulosus]
MSERNGKGNIRDSRKSSARSFEFDIPKLPIERNEMKNHLLSRQLARPAHGDQPSHFQASPNLTPKEARFRLSPVQFETPSEPLTNGNSSGGLKDASHLIAPLKTSEGDTKFHVDEEDDLRTNKVIPEVVRASPIRHLVEYQRVCIGEANTPGLRTHTCNLRTVGRPETCITYQITTNLMLSAPVTVDDLQEAAVALLKSMELRDKYMRASLQKNGRVAKRYLRLARLGSREELQPPRDAFYYTTSSSTRDYPVHPPEIEGDPFAVKYWPEALPAVVCFHKGIAKLEPISKAGLANTQLPQLPFFTLEDFIRDEKTMRMFVANGPLKSFAYRRLCFLSSKFDLHVLLNAGGETLEQKNVPHRDFYNIRKVDTHVHAASCMNQKHLLRFIKKCMRSRANEFVCLDKNTEEPITLKQLMEQLGISPYDMNIDNLDVHADRNTFHRFDKFNAKYNPIGQSQLREVFLKTDNYCKGAFFAHVLKEVFSDLEESKYQNAEPRLSIYGRSRHEWDDLAKWAIDFRVYSPNIRWVIQVPRLYDVYKSKKAVETFQDMIVNIFQPLFEVTLDPASHPELHAFLEHVSAFDSVDDESKVDPIHFDYGVPTADQWNRIENPPYTYYIFYMYANIAVLNQLRHHQKLHVFALRPHCGEAGSVSHLISTFLLAESINHGLLLRKAPVLQYLFYLCQIGLAMSPLSNNSLFLEYPRNPLKDFLARGLHVSLSTDDPLQFHFTKEPLMEEYSIAAQVWKLSFTDMCELARNSVLISGFPDVVKSHWLGLNYWQEEEGVVSNDITRTNLPNIRLAYRYETLTHELHLLVTAALDVNITDDGGGIGFKNSDLCASPLHVIPSNLLQMNHFDDNHRCGDGYDDDDDVS